MVKLSEEIKEAITKEFDQWKEIMYFGLTEDEIQTIESEVE